MDEFYEYWELVPEKNKYESIGQEIVRYKRNLQEPDVNSRDLSENVIEFFQDKLFFNPYPTYQLMFHILDLKFHQKNQLLEDVIINTIIKLMDTIIERPGELDKRDKLYNLLSNVFISDYGMKKMMVVIPALHDLKENRGLLDDALYFSLLSRNSLKVLKQYLDYEQSQIIEKLDERTIYLRPYYQNKHWIDFIFNRKYDDVLRNQFNESLYNNLKLINVILKMPSDDNDDQLESIDSSVIQNDILNLCLLELSRQREIRKFLKAHSDQTINFKKRHIMRQLLNIPVCFNMKSYDSILNVIRKNHEFNVAQSAKYNSEVSIDGMKTEMQLINEYMIVKIYYMNIVQEREISDSYFSLNHVRSLLKTINDGNILFKLIQTVLTLIFVRHDHIRRTRNILRGRDLYSIDESLSNNSIDMMDSIDPHNNSGFLCTSKSLDAILNSVRMFLMSIDITEAYKNSNDELKKKFAKMLHIVDNGIWKLRLIESKEKDKTCMTTSREWLFMHDASKLALSPEKTSDDERCDGKKKTLRKKIRRRSRNFTKTDNDHDEDSDNDNCLFIKDNVTENSQMKKKIVEKKSESIISNMLMKPESLISLCIQTNDYGSVDKILEDYNLRGSRIEHEFNFIKKYELTVNELNVISRDYKDICERKDDTPDINVDLEIGFITAKLTNALENFSQDNDLKHTEQYSSLIEKYVNENPNLSLYRKPLTTATSLIDCMLSIPNDHGLNTTILKFIFKKYDIDGNNEFYFKLLKNITHVMATLNNKDCSISISSFFNNEIYSLDTEIFKMQSQNRQNLQILMDVDVMSLNDESTLNEITLKANMFQSDLNYFTRVVNYVRNIRSISKFQTNDIVKFDDVMKNICDYDMIGKILFVNQYNPDYLTNIAYNANINLLHSIAIAASGEIQTPNSQMINDEKILSLFHLHQIGSSSLDDLNIVEHTHTPRQTYKINNTDILFYIKKGGFFLVAYLVKEIQNFEYHTLKYDEPNLFERMKNLERVERLKSLYNDNTALTILNYDHVNLKHFFAKINEMELNEKLKMLSCITERNWHKDKAQFDELKDLYIEMLIETKSMDILELLKQIGNVRKFNELLLKHIREIARDDEIERLLNWSLCFKNLRHVDENQKRELEEWMIRLKIYQNILKLFTESSEENDNMTWLTILHLAENNTYILINFLTNIKTNIELCLELLKFHPINFKNEEAFKILINALNNKKLNHAHKTLFKIIHTLSSKVMTEFYEYSLNHITNLPSMNYILSELMLHEMTSKNQIKYENFQLSCKILQYLDDGNDDNQIWLLTPYPLIIIEQLLMNSKIEILNTIVKEIRVFLNERSSCNLCSTTSKKNQVGETLVYDFDAFHENMPITNDCIDFLFKIYAAKALDFQIIDINSHLSNTSGQSLDLSQNRSFHMPKDIPTKDKWISDGEAASCMCCKKSKFSLLNRRHHCRRCGRVICGNCTKNRILLPELYNNLMVRCCDDCFTLLEDEKHKMESGTIEKARAAGMSVEWKLTGNIETDQMIRDEFTFEYIPNVSLCTKILSMHTINKSFSDFLLFHCYRLELLLKPIHPEIDIVLVAKMLKHLATASKLFENYHESNIIIDHADLILKLIENDCDSILQKASHNNALTSMSIRDAINELIKGEKWDLALEFTAKSNVNLASAINSAWAVSLIKGKQYTMAREKVVKALQPICGNFIQVNEEFLTYISTATDIFSIKRPQRSLPVLNEILEVIESYVSKLNQILTINTNMTNSLTSSKMSIISSTPKANTSTMDNLKKIMDGDYGTLTKRISDKFDCNQTDLLKSHYFEESMHYLINYGGNIDLIEYFMKNNLIRFALRYALIQRITYDAFIQYIFIPIIKIGRLADFIELIKQIDENFSISKNYIGSACKYLEKKKSLHVLYQLQLILNDYIRAAQTAIKMYLERAGNYNELNEKSRYLANANLHLQTALERVESGFIDESGIELRWDIKSINAHINIIGLQLEVSKFLSHCELNGLSTLDIMPKLFMDRISLKTLLGTPKEKIQVAILLLVCANSIESAFGLSYRIIQECSLDSSKIYSTCTKYFSRDLNRLIEVEKLIHCIKTNASCAENNIVDPDTEKMCDELVAMAVEISYANFEANAKVQIDQLIKLISSNIMKIQCYINSNQLKTAFVQCSALNSAQHYDYVKRIMKQAAKTRQENIRKLCEKRLQGKTSASMSDSMGSTSDKFY